MTRVIENWADVIGTVVELADSEFDGQTSVDLEVEEVASVPGYDNLFVEAVGEVLSVEIPTDVVEDQEIAPDQRIAVRVRRQPQTNRAFAAPDQVGPAPKGMGGAILSDDVPVGGPPPEGPPSAGGPTGPSSAS